MLVLLLAVLITAPLRAESAADWNLALTSVRASARDLDLRPDLWDGALKTPLVEGVLADPVALEPRARELAQSLSVSTGAALVELAAGALDLRPDTAIQGVDHRCPDAPLSVAALDAARGTARAKAYQAFASLPEKDREAALALVGGPILNEEFARTPDGAYAKLAAFPLETILSAGDALAREIDRLLPELALLPAPGAPLRCGGVLVLAKGDSDVPAEQLRDAEIVVNLAGAKRYLAPAAAAGPGEVRALVDLGTPSFAPSTAPTLGSGVLGVGLAYLPHLSSGTVIEAGDFSLGAGLFGVGAAFLRGDSLSLSSHRFGQGAGAFGAGLLSIDGDGPRLEARFSSQGFGFTRGAGLLRVKGGGAALRCGLHYADTHEPVAFISQCQGAGLGPRAFAGGGIGAASIEGVAPALDSGYFSQGAGYWHGLGVLSVSGDGARVKARRYTQGSGIHSAAGAFLVKGSLVKTATWGVGPGFGWDDGLGYFSAQADDGLFQADWATGRAEYNANALVRVIGKRNRLSLPGLGSGTFKRAGASYAAVVIGGADDRLWIPNLSSAAAAGSLRLPTPWGVVRTSGSVTLESGVGPEPQEWPAADREAETRREQEGFSSFLDRLAKSPGLPDLLFAASAAGFDGRTFNAGAGALLNLTASQAEALVDAADPDRFDEALWLRLAAASLGEPAAAAALRRLPGASGRKKALLLDLTRFGPAGLAARAARQALADSDARVRRAGASVLASLLGRQPGEEPGRLVQLQAAVAWLSDAGRSSDTFVSDTGLVRLPELYSYLALGAPVPTADRAALFRAAGNPFDSVSRETVAAFGAVLARDRQARRAELSRELAESQALAEAALDSLEKLLADGDPWVRASAAAALGQIGTRTGSLVKALSDPSAAAREAAASALGRMGAPGLPALSDALDAKDPALRALAVTGLAQSPEPRAVKILERALKDPDERVRLTAVAAPAAFQPALAPAKIELRPALRRLSREDASPSVRAAALAAVAAIPEK